MLSCLLSILLFWQSSDIASGQHIEVAGVAAEDRYVEIENIIFLGNNKTKRSIIEREMQLQKGDKVYFEDLQQQLEVDKRNIYNTRLFNSVKTEILENSPTSVNIVINVTERWYTFPSPILELDDRNFNTWWQNNNHDLSRINYGVKLYQKNVRGRNETLKLTAQLGFTKKFGLNYVLPSLDKQQKHGLELKFAFLENKNLAYRTFEHKREFTKQDRYNIINSTVAGFTYRIRNSIYDYHYLDFGFRRNEIADTLNLLNPEFFAQDDNIQRFYTVAYGYKKDKRDVVGYPLNGHLFEGTVRKVGLGIFNDIDFISVFAKYSQFADLGRGFYFANHSSVFANTTKKISYNNYYGLGYGINFVRGYERYVIEGTSFLLNKATIKKKLFSTVINMKNAPLEQFNNFPFAIYFKTYLDMGYVKNYPNYEQNVILSDRVTYGTGMGFDIVTAYDIVLRAEYSFNDIGEHGFFFHMKKEF